MQLGNSLFKGQWELGKVIMDHYRVPIEEVEAMAVRGMVIQLADKILLDYKQSITKTETKNFNRFNVELMVITKEQFKNIVKAATTLTSFNEKL